MSIPLEAVTSTLSPDFERLQAAPAWFQARVKNAWSEYLNEPLPVAKTETWRYSNAKRLQLQNLRLPLEAEVSQIQTAIQRSQGVAEVAAKLVFVNDRLVLDQRSGLQTGVTVLTLEQALETHAELLEKHLMQREAELGSKKFAALHLANLRAAVVIIADANVKQSLPIEIYHWVTGENSVVFPHTLIVTADGAELTVVDHHASLNNEFTQSIAVADLVASANSLLKYINIQELSEQSQAVHISSTSVAGNAKVQALQLQLGAAFSRSESISDLLGEGAHSEMFAITKPVKEQIFDMRTLQNHLAPRGFSDLLYKNSLADDSRVIFSGVIKVAEGAHYTDAYQKCRNLLNSESCEAASMPGLEINADQVKCSHGSTSAPISADEIFYLLARGIPEDQARRLIELGFLEDVIHRLKVETLADDLIQRLQSK